ncbi:MAG: hypothetical protein FJ279_12970, partial [Planctomycetes bacterium]|nr:hypothetical protein [Planctomycetota bacterium]
MFRHHRLAVVFARATALFVGLAAGGAALAANLIPDASFESRLPLWFEPPQSGVMYAARTWHPQAHSGNHVLMLSAWTPKRNVMSPPLTVKGGAVSVTFWARHEGGGKAPGLEVGLFDQAGKKQLAKALSVDVQPTWTQHKAENVAGLAEGAPVRLSFSPSGGERSSAILIDDVGLFEGAAVEPVAQNEEVLFLEAEDLVRDQPSESWERVEHFGAWYNGYPSGSAMISGYKPSKATDRSVRAAWGDVKGGRYTLWVRLHAGMYEGKFTVRLQQGDRAAAEGEFSEKGRQAPKGSSYFWDWDKLEADLAPGPVTLVLDRPAIGGSWVTRKVDCFVLTNRAGYKPDERDFLPRARLRFKRSDDGVAPYFAHCWVRRHQGPDWYYNPGFLCRAGLTRNYAPPPEPNWLGPGDASPWVDITDALKVAGRRNNFSILFSRRNHVESNLPDPIRGTLEIATGWDEPKVLRTVKIDQPTPRVWLSLPGDFGQV